MRNTRSYIVLSFFLLCQLTVFSQEANDTIQFDRFNTNVLDKLLFEEANRQRLQLNIPKLFVSEELMKASKLHSSEMAKEGTIRYSSTKAGECILTMKIMPNSLTYRELATAVIEKWMSSPGHHKLIMGDFFLYGGVGTDYQLTKEGQLLLMATFQVTYF